MRLERNYEDSKSQENSEKDLGSSLSEREDDDWDLLERDDLPTLRTTDSATNESPEALTNSDVTADWVTEHLARNTENSLGLRPVKITVKLVPINPSIGPTMVREVQLFSQDGRAANQSLALLGKSLGMFKGERVARPERDLGRDWSPERLRAGARMLMRSARQDEEAQRLKKAIQNDD